jgi:hypothetical protein
MARGIVNGGLNSGGGAKIKSIQRGISTIGTSTTSVVTSIANVNLNNSVLKMSTRTNESNSDAFALALGTLTASNSITFQRNASSATTSVNIEWEVIEYEGGVKVQTGLVNVGSVSSYNVTIPTIVVNKSILFFSYYTNTTTNFFNQTNISGAITSSTNIAFNRNSSNAGMLIRWYLLEFL